MYLRDDAAFLLALLATAVIADIIFWRSSTYRHRNHPFLSLPCRIPATTSRRATSRTPLEADNALDENYDEESVGALIPTKDSSVMEFVNAVDDTPPGALNEEQVALLRDIMVSIAADNADDNETPVVVERLLYRLVHEWEAAVQTEDSDRISLLRPTNQDFLLALKAWEATIIGTDPKSRNTNALPVAVEHVWTLFSVQEDLYANDQIDDDNTVVMKPTQDTFRTVLGVLAASRDRGMDRKAWSVFERMRNDYDLEPAADVSIYRSIITSLAKSRDRGAANRAEQILREAAERFPPAVDENGNPTGITIDCFNVVLTAWAKSGLDYGPERAEKLMLYMDELDREQGNQQGILQPNLRSFTSLIDAYAQSKDWDGVSRSERVLNRLLDQYLEEGREDLEPNVATWTIVIGAWARLSKKHYKGAAARADKLLRRMESLHEDGRIGFGPDAIAYVTCMNAFAFSKSPDGPAKAQEILEEMHERYLDGDDSMKPTVKSIRVVIDSWLRSTAPDSVEQAEKVLDGFEDFLDASYSPEEPSEVLDDDVAGIYTAMLFGWTKRGDPEQAQNYLLDMIDRDIKPDSFCFDRIIEANTQLGDEDAFTRTKEVFDLMERCSQKGDLKPNERLYTSYIRAMTKARIPNLAEEANEILRRMQDLFLAGNKGIKPTTFTYNAVLMACAETPTTENPQPLEAFKIAVQIFNELRSELVPDHVSFANMLRCANLVPDSDQKDALIRSTFQLCCKRGFVNAFVLKELQNSASEDLWRSLLQQPTGEADIERLPASWKHMFTKAKRGGDRRFRDERRFRGSRDRSRGGKRSSRGERSFRR